MNEFPYVAVMVVNRKDIKTRSFRSAIDLAASLIPERKRFLFRNWTIYKNGKVVDTSGFEGCGGDWVGRVKMFAEILDKA